MCFDEQPYNTSDAHVSYQDYASGVRKSPGKGSTFRALRRGRDAGADCVLDWLERGVFEALERKVLRALQINLFEDAALPANVLETYTFSFVYSPVEGADKRLASLIVTGPNDEVMPVTNVKIGLQTFVRRLVLLCGTLPELPERRFMNMHLYYTDECPVDYEPPLFQQSLERTMLFPRTDTWERHGLDLGVMRAGFHDIGLKVSFLRTVRNLDDTTMQEATESIPQNRLFYTDEVLRDEEILSEMGEESTRNKNGPVEQQTAPGEATDSASSKRDGRSHEVLECSMTETAAPEVADAIAEPSVTPPREADLAQKSNLKDQNMAQDAVASLTGHSRDHGRVQDDEELNQTMDHVPSQFVDSRLERSACLEQGQNPILSEHDGAASYSQTQDSYIRRQLRGMLVPSSQGDSYIETQVRESADSLEFTNGIAKDKARRARRTSPAVSLCFSQKVLDYLEERKPYLHEAAKRKRGKPLEIVDGQIEEDLIECQCGYNEEDDGMINCPFCNTWQHIHCYGYNDTNDARIPPVHVCYNCLLAENEAPVLHELKSLALLRRGLRVIEVSGFSNNKTFAQALHCDLQTASNVSSRLQQEGFFVPTSPRKSRKSSQTGKRKLCLATRGEDLERMRRVYFDPATKIAHYFEVPEVAITNLAEVADTEIGPLAQSSGPVHQSLLPPIEALGEAMDIDQQGPEAFSYRESEETDELLSAADARSRNTLPSSALPNQAIETQASRGSELQRYSLRSYIPTAVRTPTRQNRALVERCPNIVTPSPILRRKRAQDAEERSEGLRRSSRKRLKSSKTTRILNVGEID